MTNCAIFARSICLIGALWIGIPQAFAAIIEQAALASALSNHLHQPRFAQASWGVKVVSLDTGATLFEHNAARLHKPASNAKLFTGALALDRLGADFRIKTSLYATTPPDSRGRLRGDLIVYGRGDPTFAARFHNGDHSKSLAPIVDALARAGVRRIDGDLIADESFFRGAPFGGSWTWEDLQFYYGAPVSALTSDDNTIDLLIHPGARLGEPCRIETKPALHNLIFANLAGTAPANQPARINIERAPGSSLVHLRGQIPLNGKPVSDAVSVVHPAEWFGLRLKAELATRGIKVTGKVVTKDWRDRELSSLPVAGLHELARVESRPMAEIVTAMMKPSQNLYAQLLLLQAGAQNQATNSVRLTTEQAGLAELGRFLDSAGIPRREVLFDEGSGLSRAALVTPNAIVGLLRHMSRHRHAQEFLDSLPIAGVDGTLASRMKGTAAGRNVRAKTGTIRYVNSLSGYVTTAAGRQLAFSLMLNNYTPPDGAPSARADLDTIAVMLAEFAGKGPASAR
jgi:serine-type D-Ala-D-Ala carboxypeptidase/endopeptidase (penicillin-binding protein 4)